MTTNWVALIVQFIVERLHVPVTAFILLRLSLVLLASLLTLAILQWRFKAITRFLSEKSTALNLAVARVAVAATLLWQVRLHEILLNTSLDPALRVPFRIWGGLAARLVAPPGLITAIYAIFVASAVLMLIGLFGRAASAITAISAVYLISFLFLYGKVDHVYHHLIFISVLCALFPSTDTLSLDAVLAAWRDADAGRLRRSQPSVVYGYAMRCMWLFVGLGYYFPGLWKFSRSWIHWLSGKALYNDIAQAGEVLPWTPFQLWLIQHPLLMSLGSALVVLFELGFIFIILFPRLRPFAGILGLAFHNATYLALRILFIPLQSCYVIFFDWTAIVAWIGRKLSLGGARVLYDPHCKLCRRTAGTLAIFDWTNSLTFVPNSGAAYFSVIADGGRAGVGCAGVGYEGYKLIAARLPLLWLLRPFLGLPGIQQTGTAIYERVARSRTCSIVDKIAASRMLKKAINRLLTRAAQNRDCVLACVYRAATVRESVPKGLFHQPARGENLLSAQAAPLARWVPLGGLALMVMFGLLRVVDMWPLSCFPPFDGPNSDTVTQLSVQTLDTGNLAQEWNLSVDPKLWTVYRRWQWLALQGVDEHLAARPKVVALVNLWLSYHPELHVKDVVVFRDRYQMRPLEGSRIRVERHKNCEFAF